MHKIFSFLHLSLAFCAFFVFQEAVADNIPTFEIWFDATSADGTTTEHASELEGSAPIRATFYFNVTDGDGWDMKYEWRVCHKDEASKHLILHAMRRILS